MLFPQQIFFRPFFVYAQELPNANMLFPLRNGFPPSSTVFNHVDVARRGPRLILLVHCGGGILEGIGGVYPTVLQVFNSKVYPEDLVDNMVPEKVKI